MLVSFNWLKKYFDQLPESAEVEKGLLFHSFEIEERRPTANDEVMEVKILPDRNHDCLCHYGLAKEIAAIFNLPLKSPLSEPIAGDKIGRELKIEIADSKLCRRYIGRVIENVQIAESPDWLKKYLITLDQRAIANIVDASNYVMFDVGQPLHAFDADKVVGGITIRLARPGEKMVTLDNKEVTLDEKSLIIADEEGPLALAGIKGGKKAEVTTETKNLILESANFDPVNVRGTSTRLGIRTEASKRFENDLSPVVADYGMDNFTNLIKDLVGEKVIVGPKIDVYPSPQTPTVIQVSIGYISERLGIDVPTQKVLEILQSLGLSTQEVGGELTITVPFERIDLTAQENIVEEVGRIYGYDKIPSIVPAKISSNTETEAMKRFELKNKIRVKLLGEGYSEIYGYTFTDQGEVEAEKPLAADKAFLRTNLSDNLKRALELNLNQVLFDTEEVKLFEIGNVFVGGQEETHVVAGVAARKPKPKMEIEETKLSDWIAKVVNLEADLSAYLKMDIKVKPFSIYPRIIRDVAVWVPVALSDEEVIEVIKTNAGELLVLGPIKFDEYQKEDRKSLAFRLVLQSFEKTLSDEEANTVMAKVTEALKACGWEVR